MSWREPVETGLGPEAEAAPHLADYLRILRRRWRLLALAVVLAGAASVVCYVIAPKAFRASATLQIERRSLSNLTGEQSPWIENYGSNEYYPTQYRLLQSRGLAERVVLALRLTEDPRFSPANAAAGLRPSAEADKAVLGGLAGQLLQDLQIVPQNETELITIHYDHGSPEFAARVANAFAEEFIEWGVSTQSATAGRASSFLGTQIEQLKSEIQDKEQQLQSYSRRADIVALDPGSNVLLQRLEALNRDYVQAVSDRIQKEARYNELSQSPPESVAETFSGGVVGQLRTDQLRLEREYATKLQTYKPEWPAMVELKAQIDKGRQNLNNEIEDTVSQALGNSRSEHQAAQRREQALAAELDQTKSETMELNSAAVEYNNLRLEVGSRRQLFDEMLRKQSETDVASRLKSASQSNVRIVDAALVPATPFRPSLRKNLSLGLVLGLVLGVGLILLVEYLDRSLKTSEEVERLLGLPTLAVIPDLVEGGRGYGYTTGDYGVASDGIRRHKLNSGSGETTVELVPHTHPRLVVSEAYRGLRTALLLSSAEELRAVAVTSAEAGEGKTVTASNLAVVMAQLGRKVLLIDADLRWPRLHEIFGLSNRVGLVHYLTGGARVEQIFMATAIPNLCVAPAGPSPPNPAELLFSERMRELIKAVRARFDFAVLDTPPVLAVTDATLVGSAVDGVLLCLRAHQVERDDARACRDRLRLSGVRLLGTVLNRFREAPGTYGKRYQPYAYPGGEPAAATKQMRTA